MFKLIHSGLSGNTILVLLMLLVSVFQMTPLLYDGYKIIVIAAWCLFMGYYFLNSTSNATPVVKQAWYWAMFFIVIGVVYSLLKISSGNLIRDILFVLFLFPIMCLVLMDSKLTSGNVRFLMHAIAFITTLNILDNIKLSFIYPFICMMSQEQLEEFGLTGLNIGGTPFITMALFFLIAVMIVFFNTNNKVEKFIFLIYAVVASYFIIFCSFKTSVIIYAVLAVGAVYVLKNAKNPKTALLLLGVAGAFLALVLDYVIYFLIDIIGNDRVGGRLLVFVSDAGDDAHANSLEARMELWLVSLRTWTDNISSFFFGIGNHNRSDFGGDTAMSGIGNHADLYDNLARYGLLGGWVLYSILKRYYIYCKTLVSGKLYLQSFVFFAFIIITGLTSHFMLPSVSIMLFVFMPLCFTYINSQNQTI